MLNALRWYNKKRFKQRLGGGVTSCHKIRQQIELVHILFSLRWNVEFIFAEPDTILVFTIFYKLFGGGTRLAMPKTICVPDSSSLKPGSGATEGVLD